MATCEEKAHQMVMSFWKSEEGATLLEYSIMLAFIAALSLAVISAMGPKIKACFKEADKAWRFK